MAQHDERVCALYAVIVRSEQPAECRAEAEGWEVVAGDEHAFGIGGLAAEGEVGAEIAMRRHLQGVAVVESFEIAKKWITENRVHTTAITGRSRSRAWARGGDVHDFVCGGNRKSAEEEPIEHREHRGVDADTKRQ